MNKRRKEPVENEVVRRKIDRTPYWSPSNWKTEESHSVPNLFAEMHSLRDYHRHLQIPSQVRRYYRKMYVQTKVPKGHFLKHVSLPTTEASAGIVNNISIDIIHCTYTTRKLKPFIFQDFDVEPLWLKMHNELRDNHNARNPTSPLKKPVKHPINYMYITRDHIPAINVLAETYFWPGVDVSIALAYPEFSCVALYKKIVLGFGMMTPGTSLNEAYISFLFVRPHWTSCGIGSFILYHLINTCQSWNITLHSSLSNDAILLYNKFSFNVHKMVRNFYDDRLPTDTRQSGHAFFMQLEKTVYSSSL